MILDTNALSAFANGDRQAIARIAAASSIAIPVIVLGEYRFGIAHARRKAEYEQWLDSLLSVCRVLDVSAETAVAYAHLRSQLKRTGGPIPSNDLWIAALCRQHALPILTRDRHFDLVPGIRRISW